MPRRLARRREGLAVVNVEIFRTSGAGATGTTNDRAPRRHASAPKAVRTRAFTAWRRSSPAWTDAPRWRRTADGRRRREEGCQCGQTSTARGSGSEVGGHRRSSSRVARARRRSHLIRQDLVAAPDVLLYLVHGDGRRAREPEGEARDAGAQHDAVFLFLPGRSATVDGSAHAARCVGSRDVRRERGVGAQLGRSRHEGVERSDGAPVRGSPRRVPIEPRARRGKIFFDRRVDEPGRLATPGLCRPRDAGITERPPNARRRIGDVGDVDKRARDVCKGGEPRDAPRVASAPPSRRAATLASG